MAQPPTPATKTDASRTKALIAALGYGGRATFVQTMDAFAFTENLHVVRTALETIKVAGVFGLTDGAARASFKPIVYVAEAADESEADWIHRKVWSQGSIPLLVIALPEGVQVRQALRPPSRQAETISYPVAGGELDARLSLVSAAALSSSISWSAYSVSRKEAVDARLLREIQHLNKAVRAADPRLAAKPRLVNALIGRLLYLYILVDRGMLDVPFARWAIKDRKCGGVGFADALAAEARGVQPEWTGDQLWAVVDAVDDAINGRVFPISRQDRELLSDEVLHLVHRVIRGGDTLARGGRQFSFLDVSFDTIRTETISAIYQRFLELEDADEQRDAGAFYTPPFIADYVIAQADVELPFDQYARVVDPAAGSGIFLVAAYRRILERASLHKGWATDKAHVAYRILEDCIFGVERNEQAANVCRFSLYLTMLDYVGVDRIDEKSAARRAHWLFPSLHHNILVDDALKPASGKLGWSISQSGDKWPFTHVVGNPPWARSGRLGLKRNRRASVKELDRAASEAKASDVEVQSAATDAGKPAPAVDRSRPIGEGRVSDAFLWLAERELLIPGGVLGFILPTTSVVGRKSERFADAVASLLTLRHVANLSHLRYRLFVDARTAASVLVARKIEPDPAARVTVYQPRVSSLPVGREGQVWTLMVSQTDLRFARQSEFVGDANGWHGPLMLSGVDNRMRKALGRLSAKRERTFGHLLKRSGLALQRGGNPDESGAPRRLREDGDTLQPLYALQESELAQLKGSYRDLFGGPTLLLPRNFRNLQLLEQPHAFNSTFNGISRAPAARGQQSVAPPPDTAKTRFARSRSLAAIHAYLTSDVAGYFVGLFGATYMLDKARMEKVDLESLPCPFERADDPEFLALADEVDVNETVLKALSAGPELRQAVAEFSDFNRGYADGQLPLGVFEPVTQDRIDTYVGRMKRDLQSAFSQAHAPNILVDDARSGAIRLDVGFGKAPQTSRERSSDAFVAASVISFDPEAVTGHLVKSQARFAWTVEQAAADAEILLRLATAAAPSTDAR